MSSNDAAKRDGKPIRKVVLFWLGVIILGPACAFSLMHFIVNAKDRFGAVTCRNRLERIGTAALGYHLKNDMYPSQYIADSQGQPIHSWRLLLLPYFSTAEAGHVKSEYRYDEPWNGPHNSALHSLFTRSSQALFHCPRDPGPLNHTSYVAISEPNSVFYGRKPVALSEIAGTGLQYDQYGHLEFKGSSNTILSIEVPNSGIHWMEPRDVTLKDIQQGSNGSSSLKFPSSHSPTSQSNTNMGTLAVFVDNRVRWLNSNIDPKLLRSLLEIDNPDKPKEKYTSLP